MTTRGDTFTVPHSADEKSEFFHGKEGNVDPLWEELHVVDRTTRVLLAVYSRNQVFAMVSRCEKRKKSVSGVVVNVLPI